MSVPFSSAPTGRRSPLHATFGGGKVADILLWKNKAASAAILAGFTVIWFQLEVLEYQFVTLLCDILILTMLAIFFWYKAAELISRFGLSYPILVSSFRSPPDINDIKLSESTCRYLSEKFNSFLLKFFEISSGKDLILLVLAFTCLWTLSSIGEYISPLSLLYLMFLLVGTLPALHEQYGAQVDTFAAKGFQDVKTLYKMWESKVLNKIPRQTAKNE